MLMSLNGQGNTPAFRKAKLIWNPFRSSPASSTRKSMTKRDDVTFTEEQPWRQEVISRVQQHRARRRKRFDTNGTLDLDFSADESSPPASNPHQAGQVATSPAP